MKRMMLRLPLRRGWSEHASACIDSSGLSRVTPRPSRASKRGGIIVAAVPASHPISCQQTPDDKVDVLLVLRLTKPIFGLTGICMNDACAEDPSLVSKRATP